MNINCPDGNAYQTAKRAVSRTNAKQQQAVINQQQVEIDELKALVNQLIDKK